jgi:hypothetical protein
VGAKLTRKINFKGGGQECPPHTYFERKLRWRCRSFRGVEMGAGRAKSPLLAKYARNGAPIVGVVALYGGT